MDFKKRGDRRDGRRGRDFDSDRSGPPPVVEHVPVPVPAFNGAAFDAAKKYGYVWGTGRRKTSVAQVRVRPGTGAVKINGREVDEYFHVERDRRAVWLPLEVTETKKHLDVFISVDGGGTTGQAGAILLGISRALRNGNMEYEPLLRDKGLLTRDSRKVERKKYGRPGARKRFQFSKR